MGCVSQQAFDSEAFGVPYYRVVDFDEAALAIELPPLLRRRPIIIDAKVAAQALAANRALQQFGFRNVCTQISLRHTLSERRSPAASGATIRNRLPLVEGVIARHAANFRTDRFAMDPLLERAGRDRLYRQWIENSLSGRMKVAAIGANFCSFTEREAAFTIDLLSVLDQRRGIGRSLVESVLEHAARQGSGEVHVVTECANVAAWRLYLSCGFAVQEFLNCYHFVAA